MSSADSTLSLFPHNSDDDLPQEHLAFVPGFPIFYPFPTFATTVFRRKFNGLTCSYSGSDGHYVPFTRHDRLWLEAITTQAVKQKPANVSEPPIDSSYIELGNVSAALRQAGIPRQGSSIESARQSILRIAHLNVDFSGRTSVNKIFKRLVGKRLILVDKYSLTWAEHSSPTADTQPELPGLNMLQLAALYLQLIWNGGVVPVVHEHYAELSGPRQQDVYQWLLLRLHDLVEPVEVSREDLLEQFYFRVPTDRRIRHKLWTEFKRDLYHIRQNYYPAANVALSENNPNALVLSPSPPLIDPRDRRAGHIPFIRLPLP